MIISALNIIFLLVTFKYSSKIIPDMHACQNEIPIGLAPSSVAILAKENERPHATPIYTMHSQGNNFTLIYIISFLAHLHRIDTI